MLCANPAPGFARQPDRRLHYEPTSSRVRIILNDVIVADSANSIVLHEEDFPAVHYLPQANVRMDLAARTNHSTHCPFKGDASYWTLTVGYKVAENAIWSYEIPFDEATAIKNLVAFYVNKVDAIQVG